MDFLNSRVCLCCIKMLKLTINGTLTLSNSNDIKLPTIIRLLHLFLNTTRFVHLDIYPLNKKTILMLRQ